MGIKKVFFLYVEFVLIILLSLLAGYNIFYDNSQDYTIYSGHYNSVTWDNYLGIDIYFEYLYKLIVAFSVLILHIDYYLFASLIAFISLSIKFYLFSKRPYAIYLKIGYLLTLYPFYECLRTRSGLAIALVYLAIELRDKRFLSLCLLLFGSFLHYSFIPFILIWLIYDYLDDIKRVRFFLKFVFVVGIIMVILFQYIDMILGYLSFIDFRIMAYLIEDKGYFNIWVLPKYFLLFWISYLILKNRLDSINTILIFIATSFMILSFAIVKINILSLSILDISIFGYFLVITNQNLINKSLIRLLFIIIILMDFTFKILELPVFILYLLK